MSAASSSNRVVLLSQWRLLWRHWLPAIYLIIVLIFTALVAWLPDPWPARVAPLIIVGDPLILGFFFMGALVLLEKRQGMALALLTLPGGPERVLASRALLFALFGCAAALPVSIAACGLGQGLRVWLLLLAPLGLGSALFTVLGYALGLAVPTLNMYFGLGGLAMIPSMAGMLALVGLSTPWLALSPSWGASLALGQAFALGSGVAGASVGRYFVGLAHAALVLALALALWRVAATGIGRREAP